jgi:hypothetical protein
MKIIKFFKGRRKNNPEKEKAQSFNQNITSEISLSKSNPTNQLQKEIRELEIQISIVSEEKSEIEKLINLFNHRHSKELGEILIKILKLKRDLLSQKGQSSDEFYEAERDFEKYERQYQNDLSFEKATLTEDEQKEIKQKFRKASKLCHPDIVTEENKKDAENMFHNLKDAYERNDIDSIRDILNNLENGGIYLKSNSTTELDKLLSILEKLKITLKKLNNELYLIKNSEIYFQIKDIVDWDEYFNSQRKVLFQQLKELENEQNG